MPLGAHLSIAGGIYKAFERADAIGCEAVQIFTRSNRQWAVKPLTDEDRAQLDDVRERTGLRDCVVHAAYLINLASDDAGVRDRSQESWRIELERCEQLGLDRVVLHPGTHGADPERQGLTRVAQGVDRALEEVGGTVRVLLEITAGQGKSPVGWRFEHLRDLLAMTRYPERVGTCFDTCHAFAAGYDLRGEDGYAAVWREFDEVVGIDTLGCVHLNDAQKAVGSRVDRHANIGAGELGTETFGRLLRDPRLADVTMLLETPGDEATWAQELTQLKALRDGA